MRLDDPSEAVGAHCARYESASAAARLMFVEVRELVVDGSPAAYRVAGEGEPVVLVHGLSGSWRWWGPVLEPLTERRCVYVPELPRLGRRLPAAELTGWFGRWLDAAELERVDLTVDLASIRAGTLLVWGEDDRLLPERIAAEWLQVLPGARLVRLHCGHVPMWEAPRELASCLLAFLDEELADDLGDEVGRV